MIGAQSDSIGTGAGGSESVAEEGSGSLTTRLSCKVRSMFGSIAAEGKASVAGSIHPSAEGITGSELRVGADAGAISLTLSDGRAKSYSSCNAPSPLRQVSASYSLLLPCHLLACCILSCLHVHCIIMF